MSELARPDELRSSRPIAEAWLGGVCAGLRRQLHRPALFWRVLFVLAAAFRLVGVPLYLALWLAMPAAYGERHPPGVDAATRTGLRPPSPQQRLADVGITLALGALGAGLLWLVEAMGWGLGWGFLLPGLLASFGTGMIWWQVDHLPAAAAGVPWLRTVVAAWRAVVAVVVGLACLGGAALLLAGVVAEPGMPWVWTLVGLCAGAVVVAVLPWVVRARRQLADGRAEQRVAAARADMAAHLHDSVLQTLALIQRRADDPRAVAALARRQERELRAYLYGDPGTDATLAEALRAAAADVEAAHEVPVDVVTVGNAPLDAHLEPLVGAAREAMVNAAVHSGAARVDVYAEVDDALAAVYVKDRGAGFDPAAVDAGRAGIRGSIVERMERAGGRAIIRSAPGAGTEIRMEVPR